MIYCKIKMFVTLWGITGQCGNVFCNFAPMKCEGNMLENFIFSFNAILPIFIIIALGYYMKKKDFLDKFTVKKLNNIVFKFALPSMLFINSATSNIHESFDPEFILFICLITIASFLFVWGYAEIFIKDKSSIGAFVQGAFRGNYSILGIGVTASILGDADTGKSVMIATFLLPLYNILSVFILSIRNANEETHVSIPKYAFTQIVKNPMIIAIFLGIPFSYFSIEVPTVALNTLNKMGVLTMPLALLCIGADIDFKNNFEDLGLALTASFFKEILIPVTSVLIAVYGLNMRGEDLVIVVVTTSTPTAVSSFIMASNMNSNPKLTSNIILITTFFSLFSFTLSIYLLKTFNLI